MSASKRKAANSAISDDDGQKKRPAVRRKAACETCRLRKVKCDQARPKCGYCSLNNDECIFNSDPDHERYDPRTRILVERLDKVLDGVDHLTSLFSQQSDNDLHTKRSPSHSHREPAKDYLKIPTGRACADTVLTWPVFNRIFPSQSLVKSFYRIEDTSCANLLSGSLVDLGAKSDSFSVMGGLLPLPEDRIPALIDRFLQNVHTKNPILDVDGLISAARRVSEQGLSWDATSCLILLACALGAVSQPFTRSLTIMDNWHVQSPSNEDVVSKSSSMRSQELRLAESCFIMACRRLGTLKFTVLGAQCHFFAAVYLMYTIRPLEAWNNFYQSSTFYQFFLRSVGGPSSDYPDVHDWDRLQRISRLQRRLEQSLYWSCFKSEVEMRVELPLLQSDISNFEYPVLFPSPPTPIPRDSVDEVVNGATSTPSLRRTVDATYSSSIRELRGSDSNASSMEDNELRQHSRALYNEEESWYYYLTEVALRRIGNRIINTFFAVSPDAWMNIDQWIPVALEFNEQISSWSANLPASMQSFQMSSTGFDYTAPISFTADDMNGSDAIKTSVSKEMSWCIENRILEMRSWLYQPFLYYIVHENKVAEPSHQHASLNHNQRKAINELVRAGIDCNIKTLEWRTLPHRHHGIWFDLRSVVTAIIILNAIARVKPSLVPQWLFEDEVTSPSLSSTADSGMRNNHHTAVTFNIALGRLQFWEEEALDLRSAIPILREIVRETKASLTQDSYSASFSRDFV